MQSEGSLIRTRLWIVALVVLTAAAPAAAVPGTGAVEQRIADAVARDLHLELPPSARLRVLIPLNILPPDARVRVVSVKPAFTPATWLVRLACASSRDCLPFHALLSGCHPPGVLSGSSRVASPGPGARDSENPATGAWMTRSGEQVELTGGDSQIMVKVKAVCLQAGRVGDTVRVRAMGSNRIVSATVVADRIVRVKP